MKFNYFNWTPILLPFVAGLIKFKRFSKSLKILFLFVCFGTINEIFARSLILAINLNNSMPISHIYGFISFGLLFGFYFVLLKEFLNAKVLFFVSSSFLVYWIVNSLFFQSVYVLPALPRALGNLCIIVLAIIYFYKLMLEAKIVKLADEPLVWINTAILIYYTGNLFFFILFNLILEYSREFSKVTVYYFSGLNALFYILIAVGFLKVKKKS